ncbi:unnamed protein product [Caenorhabditis angaria]|uniref:Uncharacterized protein n=1 Tax=Caenorhabditis angaria TaxID=860376 RepID=A0A9P1IFK1_9PELO|nr:unnamed protein product [Caenorhabditis angaria]
MSPIKSGTSYWFWVQGGNLESAKISISLVESEQKIDFFSKFDRKKQNIVVLYCVSHCEVKISRLKSISEKINFQHYWQSTILKKTTKKIRQWIEQLENCKPPLEKSLKRFTIDFLIQLPKCYDINAIGRQWCRRK